MTRNAVTPSTRLRRVGLVMVVGYLLIAALTGFAAVDTGPGGSRQMFTLLTASMLAFALAGMVAAASSQTRDARRAVVVVALLVVSGALLLAAAMQENGLGVLAIGISMLLIGWWLVQALRANHADRATTAADAPAQPSG